MRHTKLGNRVISASLVVTNRTKFLIWFPEHGQNHISQYELVESRMSHGYGELSNEIQCNAMQ